MGLIGTREKKARVTCTISFDLEYFQKWTEKELEINANEISSYLDLPEKTNVRGVYINSTEIKCDNCSEWLHESEYNQELQCAVRGKDFCLKCEKEIYGEDDFEKEEKKECA
jgi:hypothetical protein